MYSETVKSDTKDFFTVISVVLICFVFLCLFRSTVRNILASDIVTFSVTGFVAYFVLVGCCGEFTYSADESSIILERRISSRIKRIEINRADITGIYREKPAGKCTYFGRNFRKTRRGYIAYNDGGLKKTAAFEMSDDFAASLARAGYPQA